LTGHSARAWIENCQTPQWVDEGLKPVVSDSADVVEERGEPLLLPFPCDFPYALQRLCHAYPVLRPARALLVRISLGLRPWLPQLRRGWSQHGLLHGRVRRFVRRLRSYYDGARPLMHRRTRHTAHDVDGQT